MTRTDTAGLLLVVATLAALLVACWSLTDWWPW